ncbi:DUF4134 family protein [Pedobacter hiemivivus]|uniref:DUF4134 domain-containing protein n=1 Tax=Pedobacter hiemivivus TaxID=2530454 RepID=A0A4R0N6C8_9SPHI|nr:DUF4134 family protein [Pedobacter hiemivivus]TCC94997.1 DUF4134 domain-containing protein [Pedobacter hiemivivus]
MKFYSILKTAPAVFFFALPFFATAQAGPPGIPEFYSATREMHRWYFNFYDLVMVIGTISGILGGLRIYSNWQSGKHHIDAQVMGWFFSCLFLVLIGAFLKTLYGVN